jgi:hypothetical protein
MLSLTTKLDIRRHLKVPFAGYPTSGYYGGIRTVLTVGQLETYMTVLQAEEEASITGFPYGQIIINGQPQVGDTLSAFVNGGSAITYAVQESDINQPLFNLQPIAPLDSVSFNFANLINQQNTGIVAAGGFNSRASSPVTLPQQSQVTFTASGPTFTLSTSATGLSVQVAANGQTVPSPSLQTLVAGATAQVSGYVPICNALEGQIGDSSSYLATWMQSADVVKFRPDSVAARVQVYRFWCKQLGVALSVGANPAGSNGMGSDFGTKVMI